MSDLEGLGRLRAEMARLADEIEAALDRAVYDEARDVRDDERRIVPVDRRPTADDVSIRDSIDVVAGGTAAATVEITDPRAYYAQWIEHGRKNAPAQPFVLPAYELARQRMPGRCEDEVRKVLP